MSSSVTSPFDFVKALSSTKAMLWAPETEKHYSPFLINRAFASCPDSLAIASFLNCHGQLDRRLQHDLYFYGLPRANRYRKWIKPSRELQAEDLDLLARHFGINKRRLHEYLPLLPHDKLTNLLCALRETTSATK